MNFFQLKRIVTKNNLKAEKIISDKLGFVYVSVPKVATRSVITALYRDNKKRFETHESFQLLPSLLKTNIYKHYFKFSFVRNPWGRVVSCYLNKIVNYSKESERNILSHYKGLDFDMSFDDFVFFLAGKEGRDGIADRHWLSQHKFISDKNSIKVDYIGRLENLSSDFKKVCQKIGIVDIDLPFLNSRIGWKQRPETSDQFYYRKYYTKKTKDLIAKRYQQDIDLFNYSF